MCSGWAGTSGSSSRASTPPAPLTAGPASRSRGDCFCRSTPGSWIRCWVAPPWTASPGPEATCPMPPASTSPTAPPAAPTPPTISPDGRDIYLVYNAFLEPYKTSTIGAANDRPLVGVVTHADVTAGRTVGAFSQLHRSPPGDARGSTQNDLTAEFLGDYVYAAATRDYGAAVWNDVRNAADCAAIDAWRMALRTGEAVPTPAPQQDCPATFGNSDIFGGSYADPTTP